MSKGISLPAGPARELGCPTKPSCVAYPADVPPDVGICQQRHGAPNQIRDVADTTELHVLLDYANRFHHDSNPAWETAAINDQELVGFATRTLTFTQRR